MSLRLLQQHLKGEMNLFFTLLFATCALAHPKFKFPLASDPLASPLKLSESPAGRGWGNDEKTETLPIEVLETKQVSTYH